MLSQPVERVQGCFDGAVLSGEGRHKLGLYAPTLALDLPVAVIAEMNAGQVWQSPIGFAGARSLPPGGRQAPRGRPLRDW